MRWDPESWRGNMAVCLMRTRACILQIKQDMQELSSTHGFFGHGHNECPCPLCTCDRGSMHHASGVDPQSLPFNLVTAEAYWDACRQHEVVTRIMLWTDLLQVRASLLCVKGKRGGEGGGATLPNDIPQLGLQRGDTFEPSESLWDWAALRGYTELPTGGVDQGGGGEEGGTVPCQVSTVSFGL